MISCRSDQAHDLPFVGAKVFIFRSIVDGCILGSLEKSMVIMCRAFPMSH